MQAKEYKSYKEFCNAVCNKWKEGWDRDDDDFEGIVVIAKYDVLIDIVNDIIKRDGFNLADVKLTEEMWDGYDNEYVMTLSVDGGVYVEEAYLVDKKVYLYCGDGCKFIHSECDEKCIDVNYMDGKSDCYIFSIAEDNRDDFSDFAKTSIGKKGESVNLQKNDDGDVIGFTHITDDGNGNVSYRSFYSTDKSLVDEVLKKWT